MMISGPKTFRAGRSLGVVDVDTVRNVRVLQHNKISNPNPSRRKAVTTARKQVISHLLHQLVHVPTMLRRNRTRIRDPVKQIQLLDRNGIDLVQCINYRNIAPTLCL